MGAIIASARAGRKGSTRPAAVAPTWSVNPSVAAESIVGVANLADPGTYDGTQPITAAYQWQTSADSGTTPADIGGATTLTSPVWVVGDTGAAVRKRFTVTLTGRTGLTATYSTAWSVVAGAPGGSASAAATGATKLTFTLTTESIYAGVEWGVNPDYTFAAFDAELGTTHTIVLDGQDGIVAATTYAWRMYVTSDPFDAIEGRVYVASGTVATA